MRGWRRRWRIRGRFLLTDNNGSASKPVTCGINMEKRKKAAVKRPRLFKRLRAPYRMVLINDQTLEEVAVFRLTKRSVYILFSTLFVTVILVTVSILLFTPLKYYIPGYGDNKTRMQVIRLKQTVDSLTDMVAAEQKQMNDIRMVIMGDFKGLEDTATLRPEQLKKDVSKSILPGAEEIKKDALRKQ